MTALTAGTELPTRHYRITRADLVRYAGASGDFNPIHWSDRVATSVGLPGVIAHGMYTLALAARAVAEWTEGAEVLELAAKFTNPVPVPDDDTGVEVAVAGTVGESAEGRTRIELTVTCGGTKVLGRPTAVVRG
ncbi:MaoC/PaaZ C-terminal domain-containing protein [Nocardioides limicola]|uniref:MaoC/PaaZ C-terminal domain-containing protein n=1 Tax=Nocardioides limicola TaxID=2803368 RepID=UPI00193B6DBA|nr:MaoC/PaaZ C-terminal domain-containing protein [Nocardioides sp. DJM-14]